MATYILRRLIQTLGLLILLGLTPVALGGAGAGGWFLARRALAPVDAMVETAHKIEAEGLSRRVETAESRRSIDQNSMIGFSASCLSLSAAWLTTRGDEIGMISSTATSRLAFSVPPVDTRSTIRSARPARGASSIDP